MNGFSSHIAFRRLLSTVSILASVALLNTTAMAGVSYDVTELPQLPGGIPEAYSISRAGTVVGGSATGLTGSYHATSIETSSVIPTLIDLQTLGGCCSKARGVNLFGDAVGYAYNTLGWIRPAKWSKGSLIDLGTLGGTRAEANAINEFGQVVGFAPVSGGQHAVMWDKSGIHDLGVVSGYASEAKAINNLGYIAGWSQVVTGSSGVIRGVVWKDNSKTVLGTLGGNNSYASGITDHGLIIGNSNDPQNNLKVFWTALPIANLLIPLNIQNDSNSSANGINFCGQIVGRARVNGSNMAFLYDLTRTVAVDLTTAINIEVSRNSPDWTWLYEATAINDSGQIVAYGIRNGTGQKRAYLLTPKPDCPYIPQPATCLKELDQLIAKYVK
jgi:probable HAF family extracellular repeat protein